MPPFTKDPALADHLAWLGYVQPEGLVVSAPALVDAQAIIDRAQLGDLQRKFAEQVTSLRLTESDTAETAPGIENLQRFVTEFLGWPYELLVGVDPSKPLPESLSISLPEFQETLRPSFAVARPPSQSIGNRQPAIEISPWLLLVQSHPATVDLDKPVASSDRHWHASPSKKFERLLRETGVPIGLLTNGTQFRLIYAPPKENSGALTFPVAAMTEVSGRLILGAFQLLLGSWTLFNAPSDARLPALLQRSRDYQASVSEILAEQVLHALYELLRGFEAADERAQGKLLRELAARNPADIYGGLVTVLLRLVFILFAEDRGLLPGSGLYVRHYAVRGLFERLRADAERYPDTMDHRFGAWAQLLALFRVIHGGCKHPDLAMPARAGHLFDPDRYPFLEGRASRSEPISGRPQGLPLVSDGTLHRILEKLCILEGERVSYRTLDVEEIGSVYQTIMGFGVETAAGTAIGLKGKRKKGGAPASPIVRLEPLLAIPAKDRAKWLKENADTELTGEADKRLKAAATVDDLLVALEKRIDRHATPAPVAQGGLVLQPTDERRRSGTEYTPRSFTRPIVQKTLEPILKNLRSSRRKEAQTSASVTHHASRITDEQSLVTSAATSEVPTPDQILSLKICDIAIGSGAFQVETCRQLGDELVKAWRVHGGRPALPPDETEELLAMRTIAQRCLYGVDRNPMAVDLAKLSLWLATLAKDHPFTFLDHAIRCGDSLVGLTRRQIETFTWKTGFTTGQLWEQEVRKRTAAALRERQKLLALGDDAGTPEQKQKCLAEADKLLEEVRFIGDAAVAAFFAADKDKAREAKRAELAERIADYLGKGDLKQRPTDEVRALRGELVSRGLAKADADENQPPADAPLAERGHDGSRGLQSTVKAAPEFVAERRLKDAAHQASLRDAGVPGGEDRGLKSTATFSGRSATGPVAPGSTLNSQHPVTPFHWEIEYPEVFDRENPGFDGIVGNPPFLGGTRISEVSGMSYFQWLVAMFAPCEHHCDLVAYFFRRAFDLLRRESCLGLISTNTIAQGDTREGGLRIIIREHGQIYDATRRYKWPGLAAVVVSVVHIAKASRLLPSMLDGESVRRISAYLFEGDADESPSRLATNPYFSLGCKIYGQGFVFDDSDPRCSPTSERKRLLGLNPDWAQRLLPYIGGEEINTDALLRPHRFAINLSDVATEGELAAWPELRSIVETLVKPERETLGANPNNIPLKKRWWAYQAHRPELYSALRDKPRALCLSRVGQALAFAFLPTAVVFSEQVVVFDISTDSGFGVVQCRVHELWARSLSSSMKDDLRYTPSDCFETFPFPAGFETNAALEAAGREYYEFRAALMQDLWLGLTEIYNLFHSPDDEALARLEALYRKRAATVVGQAFQPASSPDFPVRCSERATGKSPEPADRNVRPTSDWRTAESVPADRSPLTLYATPAAALAAVQRLRTLHAAMDTAVLTAYGWTDLLPKCTCEFLLDYEDDETESGAEESSGRKKKKPWRYRWPDEVRDEVLARLLKLNAERAEEERLAGVAAAAAEKKGGKGAKAKRSSGAAPAQADLLPSPQKDLFV